MVAVLYVGSGRSAYADGIWAFIGDKKGIYKDKKEWMGLWRIMGGVGIGDSGILATGLGLWKGVCGGRGVDSFCLTAAGVWIVFINGSRATVSTAAVGFVFMGFGWAAEQP